MTSDRDDFDLFLQARHAAAGEYVSGNPEPLGRLVARELPATFFSPLGDVTTGTRAVAARYADDDAVFTKGSENVMETLDAGAGDEIAFWVGLQRSEARVRGQEEPVSFDLRVTEIYRRESGQWRLVHRHADPRRDADRPG